MSDYALKVLLEEITQLSWKMVTAHPEINNKRIVEQLSKKYNLSEEEQNIIQDNINDKTANGIDTKNFDKSLELPFAIEFESEEDLDSACKTLMSRKLPWKAKGDSDYPFIQFESEEETQKALSYLKASWNFTSKNAKKVAQISFDNYENFKKVFLFMKRNKMLIDTFEDDELSNDLEGNNELFSFVASKEKPLQLDSYKRKVTVSKKW